MGTEKDNKEINSNYNDNDNDNLQRLPIITANL